MKMVLFIWVYFFKISETANSNWDDLKIIENLQCLVKSIVSLKPAKITNQKFIEKIIVSAPFIPGIVFPRNKLFPK